jgi:O-antigen ligase
MPTQAPSHRLQQPARPGGPAPRPAPAAAGAHLYVQRRTDLGVWPLALVALVYVVYVPVGPAVIANELVHGPTSTSELLPKIWSAGRYLMALVVAPALLILAGPRPLTRCWPLFPFAFFAAASMLWSAFPKDSMRQTLNLFAVVVTTSTLVTWCGLAGFGRRVQIVTGAIMIVSLLVSLLIPVIGVVHAYDLVEPVHAGKWRGIFLHKNLLGGMTVTSIVFSLRSVRAETPGWKAFFWASRLCALVCCVMAGSAAAFAGALVAVIFFALMKNRVTANPLSIVAMLLIGVALVQLMSLNAGNFAHIFGRDSTFTGRTSIWALGRPMIEEHLMFGSGLAADAALFGSLAKRQLFSSAVDLHSGYLDVLFNLGVVGAVLLIAAVAAAMLRGYAYVQSHTGPDRDQAVIFMALVIAACAIATVETYPVAMTDNGAVGLWTALPALYQLGAWRRRPQVPRGRT